MDVIQSENQAQFLKLNIKEVEIGEPVKAVSSRFASTITDRLITWRTTLEEIKEAEDDGEGGIDVVNGAGG